MTPEALVNELKATKTFLDRSTACLQEEDSEFAPVEGQYTAAQHMAHIAQTIDWFMEGAFRPEGFDMDFETHIAKVLTVTSLKQAREWVDRSFENAYAILGSKSMEELGQSLPDGPVMGGAPRAAIVGGIVDHTAHHRGALTVYSRLRGHVPAMPYM